VGGCVGVFEETKERQGRRRLRMWECALDGGGRFT